MEGELSQNRLMYKYNHFYLNFKTPMLIPTIYILSFAFKACGSDLARASEPQTLSRRETQQ